MNLANNPTLYEGDVLIRRYLDGNFLVVEPSVSVAPFLVQYKSSSRSASHLPSSCHCGTCLVIAYGIASLGVDFLNAL